MTPSSAYKAGIPGDLAEAYRRHLQQRRREKWRKAKKARLERLRRARMAYKQRIAEGKWLRALASGLLSDSAGIIPPTPRHPKREPPPWRWKLRRALVISVT